MTRSWNALIFTMIPHEIDSTCMGVFGLDSWRENWFHMTKCVLIGRQKKEIPHEFDSNWSDWMLQLMSKTFRNGVYKQGCNHYHRLLLGERRFHTNLLPRGTLRLLMVGQKWVSLRSNSCGINLLSPPSLLFHFNSLAICRFEFSALGFCFLTCGSCFHCLPQMVMPQMISRTSWVS